MPERNMIFWVVLKDYLESREKEIVDVMMALFDPETALEAYPEEYAEKIRTESEAIGEAKQWEKHRLRKRPHSIMRRHERMRFPANNTSGYVFSFPFP